MVMVREGAAAHIPFAVLFKCAARGLFSIGLQVNIGFAIMLYSDINYVLIAFLKQV